jgi:AraC-like DNA-binding protein
MIARQLPHPLPLDQAAASLGLARRSFQRALAAEGLSYTQLVAEVRFRLAGWYLLHGDISMAEVGFVCGYADQAHLTREFNRRVGVPPARYRDLFSPV